MINTPFIEKFRECVTEFYNKKYSDFSAEVLKLEGIRKKFVLDFSPEILPTLTLREFTSGNNNTTSFCNRLETELQKLGEMHGAYVNKFGVYYSNIRHQYECTKIWSKTKDYNEGLSRLKLAICRLLQDGKNRDYEAISKSKISHLFKSKILATYYPEIYLNVYSEESVREFLKILFLQYDDELTIEQNKLKLFVAKDYDERLTKLDNLMLIKFLYWYKDKLKNYADKSLWKKGNVEIIDLNYLALQNREIRFISRKTDHIIESVRKTAQGNKAEQVVVEYEQKRLNALGRNDLRVEQVSHTKGDGLGYDVLSFEPDGTKKYIEVKSKKSFNNALDFYLTDVELQFLETTPNSSIYYVFDVYDCPKIHVVDIHKLKALGNEWKVPVVYKISVCAEKAQ